VAECRASERNSIGVTAFAGARFGQPVNPVRSKLMIKKVAGGYKVLSEKGKIWAARTRPGKRRKNAFAK